MRSSALRALMAFVLSIPALAAADEEFAWKDESGKPAKETSSQKSVRDFGAMLLVTPDEDWEEKWNTPSAGVAYRERKTVTKGERLFVLIIFANPAVTETSKARVMCDYEVERPDGTISVREKAATCYDGPLAGPRSNVHLSIPVIGFVGEDSDPKGKWIVRVKVTDALRDISIPLETFFRLQ